MEKIDVGIIIMIVGVIAFAGFALYADVSYEGRMKNDCFARAQALGYHDPKFVQSGAYGGTDECWAVNQDNQPVKVF